MPTPQRDFTIRQNSLEETLLVTWTDGNGNKVAWVAGTSATFRMDHFDGFSSYGPNVLADVPAIAQNDGAGNLQLGFDWTTQAGCTAQSGLYACAWRPNIGGSSPQREWPSGIGRFFLVFIEPTLSP